MVAIEQLNPLIRPRKIQYIYIYVCMYVCMYVCIPVLLTVTYIFSLCQLSAMLVVVYQSFLCFLQCLQLHIGGTCILYMHVTNCYYNYYVAT